MTTTDYSGRYETTSLDRGTLVGRYVVLSELGRGGMGTVFAAFDPDLDRRVALKVVTPHPYEERENLGREARVLAKIEHPNVATVYDVGFWDERLFIAMELVDGGDLEAWLRPGRSAAEILDVYRQAGRGLAAAHERGIVHRDFKPSNVLVGTDGRARVADFGLARLDTASAEPIRAGDSMRGLVHSESTTGGTADFMAPEVVDGGRADTRSDQFSYCVALHWSLCGRLPSPGCVDEMEAPAAVRKVLERGLSPMPSDRFESMEALLSALEPPAPRRSVVRTVGVLAVASTTLVGFAMSRGPAEVDRCAEGQASWAESYSASRAEALRAHLASSSSPQAETTAGRVAERLSARHREWSEHFAEVCAAPEQTVANDCLSERRLEFDAMVGALESGEPDVVEHAMDAIGRMPRSTSCIDPDVPRRPPVSPAGPDDAEAAEGIHGHLLAAEALRQTAQHDRAMTEATRALEWAESIEHPPLRAEALLVQGRIHHDQGDYEQSEPALRRAFMEAWGSGHDIVALEATSTLLDVVGAQSGDEDTGELWLELGEAAVQRLGWATVEEAELWDAAGAFASTRGQTEEARAYHERAIELRSRFVSAEHPAQSTSHYSIASIDIEEGSFEEALRRSELALSLRRQALGDEHPDVALAYNTVGASLMYLARHEEAEEAFERAYTLGRATLGPEHPRFAAVRNNYAGLLNRRKDHARAKALYLESLEVWSRTRGPDDPDVALAHHNVAATALKMGDPVESLEHEQIAVRIWSEALGPDHPKVATGMYGMGLTLLKSGECAEALEPARRAVEIIEGFEGPGRRRLPMTLYGYSRVLLCLDRHEEAVSTARRAVSLTRELLGSEHPQLGPLLLQLASAEHAAGSPERAREAAEKAIPVGGDGEARSARLVLARIAAKEDPEKARALAQQAIAPQTAGEPANEALRASVEAFVATLPVGPSEQGA